MASTLIGKQGVVIGAGMGGLTAAGALADHFEQVVVLERDTLPSEPAHRGRPVDGGFPGHRWAPNDESAGLRPRALHQDQGGSSLVSGAAW